MSSPPSQTVVESQEPVLEMPAGAAAPPPTGAGVLVSRGALYGFLAITVLSLAASVLLWQKLSNIQEQLARQSADAGANAIEARTMARQAQDLARESAARLTLAETRLGEVSLQRSQLEELIQSLSRSRDENLVVDIESALRLAQQQAQLTGSAEPLLAALRTADQRLERSAQPRLSRARGAIARDIDRIRAASVSDVPGLPPRGRARRPPRCARIAGPVYGSMASASRSASSSSMTLVAASAIFLSSGSPASVGA